MPPHFLPHTLVATQVPGARTFALLAGIQAGVRAMLVSVLPLLMFRTFGDASLVSRMYFAIGIVSLASGLTVPWATRHIPRRWMFTAGASFYLVGMALAIRGGEVAVPLAVLAVSVGTATTFVCLNAYVLDHVARSDLARSESLRVFYAATAWTVGPVLGVVLLNWWSPAPFLGAGALAAALIVTFWVLRLGDGRAIARARGPSPNPFAYLGRFARQPRLVAGWLFAVLRSCAWWVYVVYLPGFCIASGLGDRVGGYALSVSSTLLFATPLLIRLTRRAGVRRTVRTAFLAASALFGVAALAAPAPWLAVAAALAGSAFLVVLDISAGLPFLMAVRPSERTEMSAVYSSYLDVSGILTPGIAWAVLAVAPIPAIFGLGSAGLLAAWGLARRLHPRLGTQRPSRGGAVSPLAP